jgi:hypothetical protein
MSMGRTRRSVFIFNLFKGTGKYISRTVYVEYHLNYTFYSYSGSIRISEQSSEGGEGLRFRRRIETMFLIFCERSIHASEGLLFT